MKPDERDRRLTQHLLGMQAHLEGMLEILNPAPPEEDPKPRQPRAFGQRDNGEAQTNP